MRTVSGLGARGGRLLRRTRAGPSFPGPPARQERGRDRPRGKARASACCLRDSGDAARGLPSGLPSRPARGRTVNGDPAGLSVGRPVTRPETVPVGRRPARRQESHAGAARRGEPAACRTPRPGQPVSAQCSADTGRAGLRGLACSLAGLGCQGGPAACAPGVQSTQGNGKSKNGPRGPRGSAATWACAAHLPFKWERAPIFCGAVPYRSTF